MPEHERTPGELDANERAKRRPLWRWILLALAPGLACDALGFLHMQLKHAEDLEGLLWITLAGAPFLGLVYLIALGRSYVAAGRAQSSLGFVIGYGLLNTFLWGAGCSMLLSGLNLH